MEGSEAGGVFTFTTLADARAIDDYIRQKPDANAVVIGGGLIGVSVTESLLKRQIKVTIIEMKERILNVILDEKNIFYGGQSRQRRRRRDYYRAYCQQN
jgi:NAD(P)H-nitrite reductase large subunit